MKFLFTTLREKSHFLALAPFIEACHRGGHEVAVAAPPDLAERVAAIGVRFFPVGHPGDAGLDPVWKRMRDVPRAELTRFAHGDVFAGVCAGAAIPSVIDTLEAFRPSVVLRESHEFAGLVAAEKVGIPHLRVAICAQGAEADICSAAAPFVDAHRRDVGLSPDPTGEQIRSERVVTLFPPSFEPPEAATARILRFRVTPNAAPPLPAWWGERADPFVYVTLGTVTGGFDMLRAMYRTILDALVGAPVRALLTIGARLPLEALGEIPPDVHIERFVPQDDVLPHAAAALFHGGSGTVLGALGAGVPMVVLPLFADQPYNAGCVAALGAGIRMPGPDVNAEQVRGALTRVLGEPSFRAAAQNAAREIAALPSVDDAAREIAALIDVPAR